MTDKRSYLDCGDDYLNCPDDYLNCGDDTTVSPVQPAKDNWLAELFYKVIVFFNRLFSSLKFW
jgi:hypothetical protein